MSERKDKTAPGKQSRVAEDVLKTALNSLAHWERGANLDEILDSIREFSHAATVSDLLFNYFRNKGLIDHAIANFADSKRGRSIKPEVSRILGLLLTQCFFQSGINPASAVNIAVGLV